MKFLATLLILGLVHAAWTKDSREVNKNQTFVATTEWQEIPEGQGIPTGLHVRINLQTGKKEAKLLDETDEEEEDAIRIGRKDSALLELPEASNNDQFKKIKFIPKRIGIDYTPEEKIEKIKQEFRSYEELQKNFEGLRKDFTSEGEIIIQLIEEFYNITMDKNNKDPESRVKTQLQILESFSFVMSQFDNALLFVDQGGLDHVILPTLVNQTNLGLKVEAMRVLGAMSQNNPKVQIKVFERNVGSHLTQILMTSTRTDELSAALYALGSLLRKFPHAQQRILSTSGTQALVAVLRKECELKIKAKAVTVIGDIIAEKELVSDDPLAAAQYAEISFEEWLQANSYCETMDTVVTSNLYGFLEAGDILEYFIQALETTRTFCFPLWSQSAQLRHTLLTLRNRYNQPEDEYRFEISQLLKYLIPNIFWELPVGHDEL